MKSTAKFVDSNVIIYAFTNNDYKEKCRDILRRDNVIINSLVLVEVYGKIQTIREKEDADIAIKTLYRRDNIQIIELDHNLFFQTMKKDSNLHISDKIHYTTALLMNCSEIISYDSHFDNLSIKRTTP